MSMIFNTLRRMESKIDHLSVPNSPGPISPTNHRHEVNHASTTSPYHIDSVLSNAPITSPLTQASRPLGQPAAAGSVLSFSAHRTIHWPGVHSSLPPSVSTAIRDMKTTFNTHLECNRPLLEPTIQAAATVPTGEWLSTLSLSCVKVLSNAYFDTFNRVYPFIDRDFYFLNTLAVVVREGFGFDIESCLVLNVMALGCMGLKAFEEGGFDTSEHSDTTPLVRQIMQEDYPGLSFFNEARKRVGFCLCERDIQSCQFHLSSAVFFMQIMRPVDEWMMTGRAFAICAAFWKCPPDPLDEWVADMHSRLFWSALMLESVIVQELELPSSGFKEWEDVVPLPKFTTYPYINKSGARNPDDAYYHYHFLAQIAVRIILSRVREELYFSNPSTALAEELRHQLEQWRANMPEALRFVDDEPEPVFDSPSDAVVVALLQARYRISMFHLGRPFLYKALSNPAAATENDLKMCSSTLKFAMNWPLLWDRLCAMPDFMPLKYFCAGQLFGQLFIFNAFKNSEDERLRQTLPPSYELWCTKMLRYISDLVGTSPTMAANFELLSRLYQLNDE
ncbi:hypothetical protein PV08_06136 [Exophiala spinifera]|uniref:Xylanolytic transcriptional activator regulatory domain-containing protein n=1 Tax=Exophiala spinifera TaxID=91928 RepID=A0A0D2BBV0_9EURO|nr:uncharacterized protein PV08_06136 [Exophiala spinifera]KIW16085.1 hypothetical protein PV08_06136 [Exophiala spinifera]